MKATDRHGRLASTTNHLHELVPGLRPVFTVEESCVMEGFAAGKDVKQICHELRIPLQSFHRLQRDLIEKTGMRDQTGLLVWARQKQHIHSGRVERNYQ